MIRIIILILCSIFSLRAQVPNFDVRGNWVGELKVGSWLRTALPEVGGETQFGLVRRISDKPPAELVRLRKEYGTKKRKV